jgi:hypothetical protein
MRVRERLIATIAVIVLACGICPVAASGAPVAAEGSTAVSVNPVLELLAGVQSQTDWVHGRGPQGRGTDYYIALQRFFAPYHDHEAVRISAELLKAGFAYDAPVAFVCHLGPLPDLALRMEYSDYVISRAGSREKLEQFRLALQRLAAESKFSAFLAQWQPKYDEWANTAAATFNRDEVVGWLCDFFRTDAAEFHFFLAPAMFPGGGYGVTTRSADGRTAAYQVIRDMSQGSDTEPTFGLGEGELNALALHEWGHSFVNPAVDTVRGRVHEVNRFYLPVASVMRQQAYSTTQTYLNEQILRAVTAIAVADTQTAAAAAAAIARDESRGFKMTSEISQYIRQEYLPNPDKYPTFAAFMPKLLDWLRGQPVPDGGIVRIVLPWLIFGGVAVIVVGCALVTARRRRRASGDANNNEPV